MQGASSRLPAEAPSSAPAAPTLMARLPALLGLLRTWVVSMLYATHFAFCFGMREGMLLLGGLQLLSAGFWLYSLALFNTSDEVWPSVGGIRGATIAVLLLNAGLSAHVVRRKSEQGALVLIGTFGLLLLLLGISFMESHPASCSNEDVIDDQPIGKIISRLLWTADACLLMTILGWVTLAAGAGGAGYAWYMYVCLWALLRKASEDVRRVLRAIAALPTRKYRADDAEECGEGASCAICLDTFEEGEEVRLLPCMHEFCKACIDSWIERQGLQANCPLCKRMLIPRHPGQPTIAPAAAPAAAAAGPEAAAAGSSSSSSSSAAAAAGAVGGDADGGDPSQALQPLLAAEGGAAAGGAAGGGSSSSTVSSDDAEHGRSAESAQAVSVDPLRAEPVSSCVPAAAAPSAPAAASEAAADLQEMAPQEEASAAAGAPSSSASSGLPSPDV